MDSLSFKTRLAILLVILSILYFAANHSVQGSDEYYPYCIEGQIIRNGSDMPDSDIESDITGFVYLWYDADIDGVPDTDVDCCEVETITLSSSSWKSTSRYSAGMTILIQTHTDGDYSSQKWYTIPTPNPSDVYLFDTYDVGDIVVNMRDSDPTIRLTDQYGYDLAETNISIVQYGEMFDLYMNIWADDYCQFGERQDIFDFSSNTFCGGPYIGIRSSMAIDIEGYFYQFATPIDIMYLFEAWPVLPSTDGMPSILSMSIQLRLDDGLSFDIILFESSYFEIGSSFMPESAFIAQSITPDTFTVTNNTLIMTGDIGQEYESVSYERYIGSIYYPPYDDRLPPYDNGGAWNDPIGFLPFSDIFPDFGMNGAEPLFFLTLPLILWKFGFFDTLLGRPRRRKTRKRKPHRERRVIIETTTPYEAVEKIHTMESGDVLIVDEDVLPMGSQSQTESTHTDEILQLSEEAARSWAEVYSETDTIPAKLEKSDPLTRTIQCGHCDAPLEDPTEQIQYQDAIGYYFICNNCQRVNLIMRSEADG